MSQWLMFSAEAQMSEKPFSDGLPEAFRRASGCFFEKSSIPEPIFRAENCGNKKIRLSLHPQQGGLAQLARALAWHARGHEFESRILHDASGQAVSIWGQPVLHTKARHSRTAGRLSRSEPANPDYRRGGIPLRERTERDSPRGLAGISARRNTPENHERIEDRWKIPPYRPTSRGCSASRSTNWSGSPPRTGCPGSPRGRSPRGCTAREPIRSAG